MKKFVFLIVVALLSNSIFSQEKKALNHDVYDNWKNLSSYIISDDGKWVSYEINPQKGDGFLYLFNYNRNTIDSIIRGGKARFSANSKYMVFMIEPEFDTLRKAKLDKEKKDKMPKDSLGIWLLEKDSVIKYEKIKSFKIPEKGNGWFAFLHEKELPVKDTTSSADSTKTEKKKKGKNKKKDNHKLTIINPLRNNVYDFDFVEDYCVAKNGKSIAFLTALKDTIDSTGVYIFNTITSETKALMHQTGYSKKISLNDNGNMLGFLYSSDTAKNKIYDLFLYDIKKDKLKRIIDTTLSAMPSGWSVSENANISFSEDGERIYFSTAPIPEPETKDTLTEDEKVSLDIWNWKDKRLQPHQLKNVKDDRERSYTAVYHIKGGEMVQLGDELLRTVRYNLKNDGNYALGYARKPYWKNISWEATIYSDLYLVDQKTGEKEKILEKVESTVNISPDEKYVLWYNTIDRTWYAYDIKKNKNNALTADLKINFYNEEHDMPSDPRPYGFAGWTGNDKFVLIYDDFDTWKIDPQGKEKPVNITNHYGRENNIRFRYVKLDRDQLYIPEEKPLLLRAFHKGNKQNGFYHADLNALNPDKLIMQDYRFGNPKKAKDGSDIIWRKSSFTEYPDLWISDLSFNNPLKITHANPQQKDYLWGSVELVKWTSFTGEELEGLLYKPENFTPDKKYPMIVYFYETYSNSLHSHYVPKPSRSVINFTYYVSNGYLIFIPDIKYRTGYPGQSAYDAIVSGTMHVAENPWVDKKNIGLQGQSWGGYQVAYLVTQTDLYKAAMAGAPVSNMTSAYGGIRWGSGLSRMFQYEESQSRIGGTLWEKPFLYIENSPLFYAPKIKTPLLIMHNDNDGAVPWYQGIEFFVALRRLNKPVWMLTYNGAPHNLKRRADCEDLTRRMQQFFDHYLKGTPEPRWMAEGVPAIKKGKEFGFELVGKE